MTIVTWPYIPLPARIRVGGRVNFYYMSLGGLAAQLARQYGPLVLAAGKRKLGQYAASRLAPAAKRYKRGPTMRRFGGSLGFDRRLKNLERCIEHKFQDITVSTTLTASVAAMAILTAIPLGDTTVSRDGSRLTVTKLKINVSYLNPLTETNTVGVRSIVAMYKDTNGASPGLLQDGTNLNSPFLHNQAGMTILYDESFILGPGVGTGPPSRRIIHWNQNFGNKGHCVKYTDGDTTGASANTCDGLIVWYAFQTTAAVAGVGINGYTRVHFVDM